MTTDDADDNAPPAASPVDAPKRPWSPPELKVFPIDESEGHLAGLTPDGNTGHS
jgi:hypothetical protein